VSARFNENFFYINYLLSGLSGNGGEGELWFVEG
jgi:hypothetical protein